tara:strand:+ start:16569 stop:16802 length:234 start_codon:yes stop_codon:yes gene_type:complete
MLKKLILHLIRVSALTMRFFVIFSGAAYLANAIMRWDYPDWRYYVVQGLILVTYATAGAVEFWAGLTAKQLKKANHD